MIALLCCSRKAGNPNSNLPRLVESLYQNTDDLNNIKLFIKVDNDDDHTELNTLITRRDIPFAYKIVISPRRDGYISIHEGYKELCKGLDLDFNVVGAIADDFVACKHWDTNINKHYREFAIFHGLPCPLNDFARISLGDQYIDEAPFWSRRVLDAVNFDWLLSFTDAWTVAIEYFLRELGVDITQNINERLFLRHTSDIDGPTNPRWHTDRAKNFEYIQSANCIQKLQAQAERIKTWTQQN